MSIFGLFNKKKTTPTANDQQDIPVVSTDSTDNNDEVTQIASQPVEENILPANWIVITDDGEFICSECSNKVAPETNTEEGTVTADLEKVKSDLTQYPTKVIYGICPICGMEFTFKLAEDKLHLEPSEMMK